MRRQPSQVQHQGSCCKRTGEAGDLIHSRRLLRASPWNKSILFGYNPKYSHVQTMLDPGVSPQSSWGLRLVWPLPQHCLHFGVLSCAQGQIPSEWLNAVPRLNLMITLSARRCGCGIAEVIGVLTGPQPRWPSASDCQKSASEQPAGALNPATVLPF